MVLQMIFLVYIIFALIQIVEKCVKTYAKKYKEIYKTDLNMLKELINDCSDFNN